MTSIILGRQVEVFSSLKCLRGFVFQTKTIIQRDFCHIYRPTPVYILKLRIYFYSFNTIKVFVVGLRRFKNWRI